LRVQLTLPGAEAQVLTDPQDPPDSADLEAAADEDDEPSAQSAAPRTQGLVASGAQDDSN
jgi:hypothetical protein